MNCYDEMVCNQSKVESNCKRILTFFPMLISAQCSLTSGVSINRLVVAKGWKLNHQDSNLITWNRFQFFVDSIKTPNDSILEKNQLRLFYLQQIQRPVNPLCFSLKSILNFTTTAFWEVSRPFPEDNDLKYLFLDHSIE